MGEGPPAKDPEVQRHSYHIPNAHLRDRDGLGFELPFSLGLGSSAGGQSNSSNGTKDVGIDLEHGKSQRHVQETRTEVSAAHLSHPQHEDEDAAETQGLLSDVHDSHGDSNTSSALTTARPSSSLENAAVLVVFVVLGAAVLLPFNTLVTPTEYYRFLFTKPEAGSSRHSSNFLSWLLLSYNVSTILLGAHATVSLHSTTPARRIYLSSTTIFLCLLILTAVTSTNLQVSSQHGNSVNLWFYGLLVASLFIAASTSYLQNAVVALCSIFGAKAMGMMLTGQGAVGAVTAIVQLFAAYESVRRNGPVTGPEEEAHQPGREAAVRAAVSLFGFGVAFIVFSTASFAWLARTRVFKTTYRSYEAAKVDAVRATHTRHEPQQGADGRGGDRRSPDSPLPVTLARLIQKLPLASQANARHLAAVQLKTITLSFCVFYIFAVTLAVYPSLTARVTSISSSSLQGTASTWQEPLVFVAWHMVTFNVADLIGRSIPSATSGRLVLRSRKLQTTIVCARTLFVPFFLACNVRSNDSQGDANGVARALPDWAFFLAVTIFGISNGFCATSVFISGPETEELIDEAEKATAGTILSFWLTLGLAVGSAGSFAIGALV